MYHYNCVFKIRLIRLEFRGLGSKHKFKQFGFEIKLKISYTIYFFSIQAYYCSNSTFQKGFLDDY